MRSSRFLLGAVFLILFSLGAYQVERGFPQDLHPDEAHWVVFATSDFQNYGNMDFADGYWMLKHPFCGMTPSGGKLIFGFFLSFFSDGIINPEFGKYDWGRSPLENRADNCFPPDRSIVVCRSVSWFFGCVAAVAFFLILRPFSRTLAGCGVLLVFSNPLFQYLGSHALLETMEYGFSLLALFFFLRFARRKDDTMNLLLSGVFAGLACSVKMRGILPLVYFNLVFLTWRFVRPSSPVNEGSLLKKMAILNVSFLSVFLLVNPSVLFSPKAKISLFLELSTFQTETLVRRFPDLALNGWLAKGKAIFEQAVITFGNTRFWPVELLLCVAGIPFALKSLPQEGQMDLILSFFLFLFLANFLWIPLAFERYFLPFIFLLKVLESLSLKEILEGAHRLLQRNGGSGPAAGLNPSLGG